MVKNNPSISVIIPAYKQERTIKKDIESITRVLEGLKNRYEIIVVIDGKVDNTYQKVKKINKKNLRVLTFEENKGKGQAVRFGMSKARGDIVAFIDAGMDINPRGIPLLLEHFKWYNADVIVGSKVHAASKVNYPWQRKILSWGYRMLVYVLFGLKIRDTQVGLKLFRKKVLKDVLPRLLVKTYAFDIEILAVANRLNYRRIYEGPVELDFRYSSSITSKNFWSIIFKMLWDTAAVFYRLRILKYYDTKHTRKWKYDKESNLRMNLP